MISTSMPMSFRFAWITSAVVLSVSAFVVVSVSLIPVLPDAARYSLALSGFAPYCGASAQ